MFTKAITRENPLLYGLIALIMGLAVFMIPVHYLIAGVAVLFSILWLCFNPLFFLDLLLFTLPDLTRIRDFPNFPAFTINEAILFPFILLLAVRYFFDKKKISLRTRMDGWIVALTILMLLASFFSEAGMLKGMLAFWKFTEAILTYYMTIYCLRSHLASRAHILRLLLWTGLFQALLGTLQSLTGQFGASFHSERGYLGYLHLGSSSVWHGQGTMYQFNSLGHFLVSILLVYLPLHIWVVRRKTWSWATILILMTGIITTYSRGSLLGLVPGIFILLYRTQKTRLQSLRITLLTALPVAAITYKLSHSDYVGTVGYSNRLRIWQLPLHAITRNWKSLWLGSGINSYEEVTWSYIPGNVPPRLFGEWFAHNFYLLNVLELGILGSAILFGFLLIQYAKTWISSIQDHGFQKVYGLSLNLGLLSVFAVGIFDHSYAGTNFRNYLFILLGIYYAKKHLHAHP